MVGRVSRVSPEAPVPIVEFEREFSVPGGAANVAHNARALGARVTLIGLVGDDAAAVDLRGLLDGAGHRRHRPGRRSGAADHAEDPVGHHAEPAGGAVDVERDRRRAAALDDALAAAIEEAAASAAAIIVSDYLKGVVTQRVMAHAIAAAHRHGVPVLVDPKVPHLARYAGATLLTPNHHEAELATGVPIREAADARRAARTLAEQARVDGVLVTWGERGVWLSHRVVRGAPRRRRPGSRRRDRRRRHGGRRPSAPPWRQGRARPRRPVSPTRRLESSSRASARPPSAPTTCANDSDWRLRRSHLCVSPRAVRRPGRESHFETELKARLRDTSAISSGVPRRFTSRSAARVPVR